MALELDHLVVCAQSLAEGAGHVSALTGAVLQPGGRHAAMGTRNLLLSLGSSLYLEVIAIDPDAPAPLRPRWFALDEFTGPPRLAHWVARCDDLEAALAEAPAGAGEIMALSRGDLRWRMAVPESGRLPFGGMFPGLIEWQGRAHPAARLPDSGCRLLALEVIHPRASELAACLPELGGAPVAFAAGPRPALRARLSTPAGDVVLQ